MGEYGVEYIEEIGSVLKEKAKYWRKTFRRYERVLYWFSIDEYWWCGIEEIGSVFKLKAKYWRRKFRTLREIFSSIVTGLVQASVVWNMWKK